MAEQVQEQQSAPMTPHEAAMEFFREHDWSPEQAAGIVGNLDHESAGLQPNIRENGGKGPGFGLAQWTSPDRVQNLMAYAKSKGETVPSFPTQLEFVQWELDNKPEFRADILRNAKTIDEATYAFAKYYERPGKPMMESRLKRAYNVVSNMLGPSEASAAEIPASSPPPVTPPQQMPVQDNAQPLQPVQEQPNTGVSTQPVQSPVEPAQQQPEQVQVPPQQDRAALLAEAYKRGILPPDIKANYEEAIRRGLIKGDIQQPAPQLQEPEPIDWTGMQGAGEADPGTVGSVVKNAAPIAGAITGAALASPGGPLAMMAGGALGYGAGKQLGYAIEEAAGNRERPSTADALLEAGKDLAVGATYALPGGQTANVGKQVLGAGLGYGAAQQEERAYNELTGKTEPLSTGEALVGAGKDIVMGSATALPFSVLPWAVNLHAERRAATAETRLDAEIDKISRKAFASGVAGQRTAGQASDYTKKMNFVVKDIALNKDYLQLTNPNMEESLGRLPENRMEMLQAIAQGKKRIFGQFDSMKNEAGETGIMIQPEPIVEELLKFSNSRAAQRAHPEAVEFARQQAKRLMDDGPFTLSEAQETISAFNNKLDSFYSKGGSLQDTSRAAVDAIEVGTTRKLLDEAISSVKGPGYQELKNAYGSYAAVERDIARSAVTGSRAQPRGLIDFFDIATAHQAITSLASLSPTGMASTAAMMATKKYIKNANNRDRMVNNMFGDVDKFLTKQSEREMNAPFVPGGGVKIPTNEEIAQIDAELAELSDKERRVILERVYRTYNLGQKQLPPGQGFRMVAGTGKKALPAPEDRLQLPAGQGFELRQGPVLDRYSPELSSQLNAPPLLPPGQGFRILGPSEPKKLPAPENRKLLAPGQEFILREGPVLDRYSPELAESIKPTNTLALPPGQGYTVVPESGRKSQTELRSELFGLGSPKTPPVSDVLGKEVGATIQEREIPPEAARIITLVKEALAKRKRASSSEKF